MISFGGFLNSNFWQTYRQHGSSSIEDLLSKSDCTVEKLLEDEDIIQEFKTQNNKLLTYFNHDKMKRLIDFITVMPADDATTNRGHKYPFLALEIFNCEINPLLEKFFEAPEPKQAAVAAAATAANEDVMSAGGDDNMEIFTDGLGAAPSDEKPNDLDFDNVFNVTSSDSETKTENTFSFDTPAQPEDTKEEDSKVVEEKPTETPASAETSTTDEPEEEEKKDVVEESGDTETTTAPAVEEAKEKEEVTSEETEGNKPAFTRQDTPQLETMEVEAKETATTAPAAEDKETTSLTEVDADKIDESTNVEVIVAKPEAEETKSSATEEAVVVRTEEEINEEDITSSEVTASTTVVAAASTDDVTQEVSKTSEIDTTEAAADTPNEAEKSSFEDEPEKEAEGDIDATQATTVAASSAENSEDEQVSKYMLLERLFKFLDAEDDEPVNAVLAGYFSKVVQLLVNRKQKQIVPYIIADENKVIENLLKHVYSRSVAEVIHRLLHIVESNFDDELSAKISEKKQVIMSSLIEKLKCENEDETVMNATFILQDLMESKSFFQILTKRQNMQKMFETAFRAPDAETGMTYEESSFETQGLIARFVQQFNERQQQSMDDDDAWDNNGEDDDIIGIELSDDENEDSKNGNNAAIIELLVQMIEPIKTILEKNSLEPIQNQFNQSRSFPLGKIKLRAIELLQSIVSLKKQNIITAVRESGVMRIVLLLIEKHPWNNMSQLKAHQVFEDLFKTELSNEEKISFIKVSEVTSMLVRMAQVPEVKFASGNSIRNGFMGFVIKLANLIKTKTDMITDVEEQSEVLTQDWQDFLSGELERSNERNARNLGGRTTQNVSDDDETNQFDVNMDNIMKRFKCFNTIMSNNTSTDEDEKEEEDETINEPDGEGDADTGTKKAATAEDRQIEVILPKMAKVNAIFADSGYWKVDPLEDELNNLLADYE